MKIVEVSPSNLFREVVGGSGGPIFFLEAVTITNHDFCDYCSFTLGTWGVGIVMLSISSTIQEYLTKYAHT